MKNEFKGTKGEWFIDGIDIDTANSSGIIAQVFDGLDTHIADQDVVIQKSNAELIAEAGNVRQQIDFTLTELLEKYNEYNELKVSRDKELEKAVMYGYNTFEHGLSQRQLEKRAEAYPLSQIVEP